MSSRSDQIVQSGYVQLPQRALTSMQVRSTDLEQQSGRIQDEVKRKAAFLSAKVAAETVAEMTGEGCDPFRLLNDYYVSKDA